MKIQSRLSQDLEASAYLTAESFEKIINFLEKHTGFATELIPLAHAEKLIQEKFKWPIMITHKIVNEMYQYWVKKVCTWQ